MIYKVVIETPIGPGVNINHHFEQVVDTEEECRKFGEECALHMQAYAEGFSQADLGEDD